MALGLLLEATDEDLRELEAQYGILAAEMRYVVRANLTMLSLIEPLDEMPDPRPHRALVQNLLRKLESTDR